MLKADFASSAEPPLWLTNLLTATFFNTCAAHPDIRKSERNIFCLDCAEVMCPQCASEEHNSHKCLQVRRYVYHDVLRVQDINKLLDTSGVQTYIVNSCRVVFLNQRPQPRPNKHQNVCETCSRTLQDEYSFCSLCCKVESVFGGPRLHGAQQSPPASQPASPMAAEDRLAFHSRAMEEYSPSREASAVTSDSGSNLSDEAHTDYAMTGYVASSGEGASDLEQFSPFELAPVPKRSRNGRKELQQDSPKSVLSCGASRRRKSSTPQRAPAY